jgi:hypothetical protein
MRKSPLALAGAALAVCASSASGDLIATFTINRIGGNDIFRFFATNNGANGTGTKLLAVTATAFTDANNLIFKITDADGDLVNDADVNGRTIPGIAPSAATIASSGGSYVRFGTPASFLIGGNIPEGYSDANGDGITDVNGDQRAAYYQNAKTFRVDGFNGGGGIAADVNPVMFAALVMPAGTNYLFVGQLAGETGPQSTFFFGPEPGSATILALASTTLLTRRRRRQS